MADKLSNNIVAKPENENELSPNPAGSGFIKQLEVSSLPLSGEPNVLYLVPVYKGENKVSGYFKWRWNPVGVWERVADDNPIVELKNKQEAPNTQKINEEIKTGHIIRSDINVFGDVHVNGEEASQGTGKEEVIIVELDSLSGTLSEEDYTKLLSKGAVIKSSTQYFYKEFDSAIYLTFKAAPREGSNNKTIIDYVQITKSSKEYQVTSFDIDLGAVYTAMQSIKNDAYKEVNITTYPTLADFLESSGEEGTVYLYPIDTSESPTFESGYYRYIWEGSAWVSIGTTKIDLSDYATKNYFAFKKISLADFNALEDADKLALLDAGCQIIGSISIGSPSGGGEAKNPVLFPRRNYNSYSQGIFIAGSETQNPTVGTYEALHDSLSYLNFRAVLRCSDSNLRFIGKIEPNTDNAQDIGSSSNAIQDIYFKRNLKDGSRQLNLKQIYDGIFNVINASDIVSNTLTQAQFDLIANGKPTLIRGTILGYTNPLIVSLEDFTTTLRGFMFTGRTLRGIMITVSSRILSDSGNDLHFDKVNQINGKVIPDYPSDTGTFVLKCVDGTLTWVAE